MFKRIVFATDFSEAAGQALGWAKYLAEHYGAELHLLHVKLVLQPNSLPVGFSNLEQLEAEREADAHKALRDLAEGCKVSTRTAVESDIKAASAIARYATDHKADLIVVGSHGYTGLKSVLLGSETRNLLRVAETPVLVIRPDGQAPQVDKAPFQHILAPVDLSEASAHALTFADRFAVEGKAKLQVLHVVEVVVPTYYPQMPPLVNESDAVDALNSFLKDVGTQTEVQAEVMSGPAASAIIECAEEGKADLILMSRTGLSGWQRFIVGSVTERVLQAAPCTVLVLPPEDEGRA